MDFIRILTSEGIVPSEEIVNDVHCAHPSFLDFSVEKSRLGLGLETIDVVYLNNFSEAHLYIRRYIVPSSEKRRRIKG
jgi:aryl-alcohol dehydrogenase-like predicted oxidoreductase